MARITENPPTITRIRNSNRTIMTCRISPLIRLLFLLATITLITSCASSNGMVRKCNGQRGTRVAMGVL